MLLIDDWQLSFEQGSMAMPVNGFTIIIIPNEATNSEPSALTTATLTIPY